MGNRLATVGMGRKWGGKKKKKKETTGQKYNGLPYYIGRL